MSQGHVTLAQARAKMRSSGTPEEQRAVDGPHDAVLSIRVPSAVLDTYRSAARAAGTTLTAWVRGLLDAGL